MRASPVMPLSNHTPPSLPFAVDDALLERYIVGECTPAERGAVEAWIRETPPEGRVVRWLQQRAAHGREYILPHDLPYRGDPERVRAEFVRRITADGRAERRPKEHRPFMFRRTARGRVIAGITALVGAVASAWMFGLRQQPEPPVSIWPLVATTSAGATNSVVLADGTHLRLAPRTTVRMAPGFGVHNRLVAVEGEVYFEVRTHDHLPFVVQTGRVSTRVLGTTFDVRRYPSDDVTRIAVLSGHVAVMPVRSGRAITLTAGMVGRATDSSTMVQQRDSASRYAAWIDGTLIFHEAPAPEVLAELTRWYGYRFAFSDSVLLQKNLTAAFTTHSRSDAMAILKLVLDVDLTFDGMTVTLHPRHPGHRPATGPHAIPAQLSTPLTTPYSEVGR